MNRDFTLFMHELDLFLNETPEGDIFNLRNDFAPSDDWFEGISNLRSAAAVVHNPLAINRALRAFVAVDTAVDSIDAATADANPFIFDAKADAEDMAYNAIWQVFERALAKQLVNAIAGARAEAHMTVNQYLKNAGYEC